MWVSGSEYEDPDDPTVIAENELLGAANSIDAAAKKLEKLRPRKSIRVSWCQVFYKNFRMFFVSRKMKMLK